VTVDEFEKIELLLAGEAAGIADVFSRIGAAAVQIERDALHGVVGGDGLDFACDLRAATLELGAKLGGDGVGAILIGLLKRVADGAIDGDGDDGDAEQHGCGEEQEKLFTEAHREAVRG
jgi:hypothetical protein